MLCLSLPLKESFLTYHRSQDFFYTSFLGAGVGGELSPHLRLFLMVRPFLSTDKISFSQTSSSQNLKLSIVSVREDSLVSRVDGIPDGRPIQVKNIYKCGFKNIRICVDGPFHDSRDFKIQRRVRNENVA